MRAMLVGGMGILTLAIPAAAQTMASPPVPVGSAVDWIHPDDYPPASIRMGEEGRVSVQLAVDATGAVTGCTVTNSSGHPVLDARTCALLTLRAHFQPAYDAAGQAMPATTPVMTFRWTLPKDVPPVAPALSAMSASDRQKVMDDGMSFVKTISSAPLPADQPLTPARIALAGAMIDAVDKGTNASGAKDAARAAAEARFAEGVASLPERAQGLAKADFQAAYDTASRQSRQHNLDFLRRAYAARMTDDEMRKTIAFFSSGIGYRSIHHGAEWTQADQQSLGMAMLGHPELAKWTKANLDLMQGLQAQMQAQQVAFRGYLMGALCPALAHDHIQLSTCPAVKPMALTGKARPPRLLTTHF